MPPCFGEATPASDLAAISCAGVAVGKTNPIMRIATAPVSRTREPTAINNTVLLSVERFSTGVVADAPAGLRTHVLSPPRSTRAHGRNAPRPRAPLAQARPWLPVGIPGERERQSGMTEQCTCVSVDERGIRPT